MNPAKLKVVELRAELSARGLDTKGNKAVLVERLQEALDQEEGDGGDKPEEEEPEEDRAEEQHDQAAAKGKELETEPEPEVQQPASQADSPQPEQRAESEGQPEPEQDREPSPEPTPVEEERVESPQSKTPEPQQREQTPPKEPTPHTTPTKASTPEDTLEKEAEPMEVDKSKYDQYDPADTEDQEEDEKVEEERKVDPDLALKEEKDDPEYSKHLNQAEENGHKEGFEDDYKPDIKSEGDIKSETDDGYVKSEHRDYESRDRKRKRSVSPRGRTERKFSEWEPEIKEDAVTLSWYDSDLNLTIEDKSFLEAKPFSDGGFGYVWAGVRGTYGYTSGSICYQVKVNDYMDISHLEDEPNPNLIRVGWSPFSTSLQLGEEPFSYGYGGTGKFSVNCKFSDYGKAFGLNDVVTCYLQFTEDEAIISFGVNDEYLGVAQRVPKESLEDKALAPHILTKNAGFKVNFGQEEPWAEVQEGFEFVANFPVENATAGPKRPEKRSDCEMIMMCGLPACGKTVWATKHAAEHPEKNYNILGTNALIDRMKVMGLPRKANYHGRWDVLIEKCTKCLQRLMDIGCHRRRNYILDQTNVFPAAQRRKMRNFEGFTRKAVVIVPTDEEFQSRTEKQASEEKKDVPEAAVLEMKANFTLPDKTLFDEVTFVELQEEEAQALIEKYSKEAEEKGHFRKSGPGGGGPPAKRFRGGDFHNQRNDNFRRDRFSSGPQGSPFRRGSDRGGPRGGGGGWGGPRGGGGGSGDRWRDRQGGGYGRPQGDRSGWRGPPSGPPGGNGRGPRDYDRGPPRSGGYDRNSRSGPPPRQGGGGGYGGNRDYPRDNRGPAGGIKAGGMGGKPRPGDKSAGGQGNVAPAAQWNQYSNQHGQSAAATGQQAWGQQAQWGQQQAQAWSNYQQQWKGYQQGYNQQGYGQGYNPQQYNNWQQYYGNYQQPSWGQQNSDGTYNYPQNWQSWYAAQSAGQASTAQQPPQAK